MPFQIWDATSATYRVIWWAAYNRHQGTLNRDTTGNLIHVTIPVSPTGAADGGKRVSPSVQFSRIPVDPASATPPAPVVFFPQLAAWTPPPPIYVPASQALMPRIDAFPPPIPTWWPGAAVVRAPIEAPRSFTVALSPPLVQVAAPVVFPPQLAKTPPPAPAPVIPAAVALSPPFTPAAPAAVAWAPPLAKVAPQPAPPTPPQSLVTAVPFPVVAPIPPQPNLGGGGWANEGHPEALFPGRRPELDVRHLRPKEPESHDLSDLDIIMILLA